jgi:HipA-like C-terminal domain
VVSKPFTIYRVPDDAPAKAEAMGTKPKFWFERDGAMWLFKATRPGQGEHWAEVLAAELASKLGLPHARYELARWRDSSGVVTQRFTPDGFDLVHGNELLAERDPSYPSEGARYIRTREHTIDAVKSVVGSGKVGFPLDWTPPSGIDSPVDVFAGYLLLDAWIGNTDRHHENWGLVFNPEGKPHLAPTFDHASSLGAHETDEVRTSRIDSPNPAFSVKAYVQRSRVRSALYLNPGDPHPLGLLETFSVWAQGAHAEPWLDRLDSIDDSEVDDLTVRMAASEASGPAMAFAQAILKANKGRIMGTR